MHSGGARASRRWPTGSPGAVCRARAERLRPGRAGARAAVAGHEPEGRARRVLEGRAAADEPAHAGARVAADGGAYLDELAKVADEPFAITGYCMGARLGRRIAAAHFGL